MKITSSNLLRSVCNWIVSVSREKNALDSNIILNPEIIMLNWKYEMKIRKINII